MISTMRTKKADNLLGRDRVHITGIKARSCQINVRSHTELHESQLRAVKPWPNVKRTQVTAVAEQAPAEKVTAVAEPAVVAASARDLFCL